MNQLSSYKALINGFACRILLAVCLGLLTAPVLALSPSGDWKELMEQYTRLKKEGQYSLALAVAQKALTLAESRSGTSSEIFGESLLGVVHAHLALGQYAEALPLEQRLLAFVERKLGPDHPEIAFSLENLAKTHSKLGQHDKALPLQQQALATFEKVLGPEHPTTALSLINLAETYSNLAQHDKALPLQLRALAIREKVLRPDHPDTAVSLSNLATTYRDLAQYDKALPLQLRALTISEKVQGPDHRDTAVSLKNLAMTHSDLAQYDKALPLQQRALAKFEKVLGPEHPITALTLLDLATTYSALAQYDKALPLQERALTISEKVLGPAHSDTALSLDNLATTYSKLGLFGKALPLQQRALAITEKMFGPEHPYTATCLGNLALTYVFLSQYDKALPLQQRALAITEKMLGPEHPYTATSLGNLAVSFGALAQHNDALPLQQRALAIVEKMLGPEHLDSAVSLNNLAATYRDLAQYEKAFPLFQRALNIRERALGPNHPDTASVLGQLALLFKALGQNRLAIVFAKQGINIYQMNRQEIAQIGSTELKSYTDSVATVYRHLASFLVEQARLAEAQVILDMLKEEEQFEFVRRSSTGDHRSTRIGYSPTEQAWMVRYRKIADQLATMGAEDRTLQKQSKLGLSVEQKLRQKSLRDDLQIAQKAFDSFLGEMREGFARQGSVRSTEVEELSQTALRAQQELIKGLGEDVMLLRYYVTEDKVGMLLTTPGVSLARSSAINAKDLNRQILEFRQLLGDGKKLNPLPAAQALYQLLIAPLAADLDQAGAKTIMLSLDGALRYLPFGALHDGSRYLVERWNLPMYTSVTKNRLLNVVAPQWQAAGFGVTRALSGFKALPAVGAEMNSIIKLAGGGVLPGEVYLDQAFTANRLLDVSQRSFQLLHVASHFQFSPGTEVNSFLLLGDGEHLSLGDIRTKNFRFDNVDLLTLSACDTGLGGGRDAQGREIEGFGVIAQQQGAKAVLATLWPVADRSTATLMAEMYRRRQSQHLTKIEALRQAQLSLLGQSRYAHPFYWAPFILMGNWK